MNTITLGSPENPEFAQIINLALECNQEGISVVEDRLGSIKIKVTKDQKNSILQFSAQIKHIPKQEQSILCYLLHMKPQTKLGYTFLQIGGLS